MVVENLVARYDEILGRLAQLARASPLQGGCHRFESCSAHSIEFCSNLADWSKRIVERIEPPGLSPILLQLALRSALISSQREDQDSSARFAQERVTADVCRAANQA